MTIPKVAHGVEISPLLDAVRVAGEAILEVYKTDFEVEYKGDDSPLTAADQAANAVLMDYISRETSDIPVISEENKAAPFVERSQWKRFWLVDPLDGTKEFIKKNGEFTVNIALISEDKPLLGVVYQPTEQHFYLGIIGEGSWKIDSQMESKLLSAQPHWSTLDRLRVVASRSHQSDEVVAYVKELEASGKTVEFISAGSSLKFCLVAEGSADIYPRLGPTMEWDTGAAHAVALAAGRSVLQAGTDEELVYNKENLLNPYFIVA